MRVGINASFARKFNTGIGQVTVNYLKALNKNIQGNNYILYLEEESEFNFSNFKKKVFLPVWKRDDLVRKILWEKYLLPRKIKKDRCEKFISLYQCPTILSKNVEHIMVVHDIIPKLFREYVNNFRKKYYWKLTEKAIKKADKIIAVSEHTKNDLIKYLNIPEEKIEVGYIDADNYYKREISEDESNHVLKKYGLKPGYIYNAGGLDKRKNVLKILEAYKILLEENSNVPDLVISGKLAPELAPLVPDVEKVAKSLGIEDRVEFLDFISQEDMPALYKNARVFVYPSLYEGFGIPPLEAMNCGTPVIVSKTSSLPEVGGDAVIYVDPQSSRDIAQEISKLLNNAELRENLIRKGRAQSGKFLWDNFVKKI